MTKTTVSKKPSVDGLRIDYLMAAIEALRYKAHNEAAQSQAPDLFDAEDTEAWLIAEELQQAISSPAHQHHVANFKERRDVLVFHQKFCIPMASAPSFLDEEAFKFRLKFMREELNEFEEGHQTCDMHEAADALVDLAYVLHGTALIMGLPWPTLWDEVQRANMAKIRAAHAGESKRGSALDVIKPAGWTPPDHTASLGKGPWPRFNCSGDCHETK